MDVVSENEDSTQFQEVGSLHDLTVVGLAPVNSPANSQENTPRNVAYDYFMHMEETNHTGQDTRWLHLTVEKAV